MLTFFIGLPSSASNSESIVFERSAIARSAWLSFALDPALESREFRIKSLILMNPEAKHKMTHNNIRILAIFSFCQASQYCFYSLEFVNKYCISQPR